MSEGLECKINVCEESGKVLEPQPSGRMWSILRDSISGFWTKKWRCLKGLWNMAVEDPSKLIHCLKVGLALTIVSLFYYMRPLNDAIGGNAMWALLTVVVIFEYSVGATLSKTINRAIATIIGGSLGIGVHWIAGHCGKESEPIVSGISVFLFASAATFSRFIPSVKARFDYGAVVFILTFTFISVSGYRVDKLVMLAEERISTTAIGASICIIVNMLVCPVWAGDQLHHQTISNLVKLADSLEGCVSEYFRDTETSNIPEKDMAKNLQGYKCLLKSQALEETMENFSRWEPPHGHYHSGHPWKQYLKICVAVRNCAYCIDNLNSCINSEMQVPEFLKNHIKEKYGSLSFCSSEVLKELAAMIRTRIRTPHIDGLIEEMDFRAEELQISLSSLSLVSSQKILLPLSNSNSIEETSDKVESSNDSSILGVLALGCIVTLMMEIVARTEEIVLAVDELATLAEFEIQEKRKSQVKEASACPETDKCDQEAIKVLEKV